MTLCFSKRFPPTTFPLSPKQKLWNGFLDFIKCLSPVQVFTWPTSPEYDAFRHTPFRKQLVGCTTLQTLQNGLYEWHCSFASMSLSAHHCQILLPVVCSPFCKPARCNCIKPTKPNTVFRAIGWRQRFYFFKIFLHKPDFAFSHFAALHGHYFIFGVAHFNGWRFQFPPHTVGCKTNKQIGTKHRHVKAFFRGCWLAGSKKKKMNKYKKEGKKKERFMANDLDATYCTGHAKTPFCLQAAGFYLQKATRGADTFAT